MPSVTHPLPCIVYLLYVNFDECIKALINFSIAMHGSRYFGKFKEKNHSMNFFASKSAN